MERLLAVAYGCALRTTNTDGVAGLAQDVYDWIFRDGQPPPHILLRDYARGVIEVALRHGASLNVDTYKIRPPYRSDWPSFEIPDLEDLKYWREWKNDMLDKEWARVHLYDSVMGEEDFSRYVIRGLNEWSSERLGEAHNPTHRELHDQFVESLTKKQKQAWDVHRSVQQAIDFYRHLEPEQRREIFKREFTNAELDTALQSAESTLIRMLGKNSSKYKLFCDAVAPYVAQPHAYYHEDHFDGQLARRWMMKKIIDLGWTVERFGKFDRNATRYFRHGREANKPERIGKKYQWIAFHELRARLSDNFKLREDKWSERRSEYHGPWNVSCQRDIDPSNLLRKTERETWGTLRNTWWFPLAHDNWELSIDDVAWLKNVNDLPVAEPLIEVTNPADHSRWLVMEAFYEWGQPTPPGEDRYEIPRCRIWYMLKSYLVRKRDAGRVFAWAKKQNFMRQSMPESRESIEIFLGEFFWAPVFQDHDQPYFHRDGWTRGHNNHIPAEVLVTTDGYMQERGTFDCSLDETIIITLPCKFLAEGMDMRWNGVEGRFFNKQGNLIAFDPSVRSPGPGAFLIRKESLLEFLDANDLQILWTLLGEKERVAGAMTQRIYKGRLEISGAYRLTQGTVQGTRTFTFMSPSGRT